LRNETHCTKCRDREGQLPVQKASARDGVAVRAVGALGGCRPHEEALLSATSGLQAFLLVLASAVNPGALVASAFFLRTERAARLDNAFLIGGLLISAIVGIVVLALIRLTGLELPKNTTPRYDVRLALGILALLIAAALPWLQKRLQRGQKGAKKPSRVTQLMQRAGIGGAILVGVLVFAPTVQYLGGLQVIATAEHRVAAAVLWILLAAVVNVALVWLFLIAFLANPRRTKAHLDRANTWVDWVKAHSEVVIRVVLLIVGVYLVINGAIGLTK
jgi:arginine exporter protein ArgO